MTNDSNLDLRVFPDGQTIAHAAADLFVRLAARARLAEQPFRVALSGGSTPKMLYKLLASIEYSDRVQWDAISFFFGDERWVPHDDPESNYGLARDELFAKVPIDEAKVFPMPTEGMSPDEAAAQYEATIAQQFGTRVGETPELDLIFLGMGEDGHTASCFPFTDALAATDRIVVANFVPKFPAYRLTLTPAVLQAGKEVLFMVGGENKAVALRQAIEGEYNPEECPSQLLRHAKGKVIWLVDQAAASLLNTS